MTQEEISARAKVLSRRIEEVEYKVDDWTLEVHAIAINIANYLDLGFIEANAETLAILEDGLRCIEKALSKETKV